MDVLSRKQIRSIAESFLGPEIDPVPKYRLLRDVLLLPPDHPELVRIKKAVLRSKWVRDILALQHGDGSWGYFHSLSSPTKERPMTTEQALRRLLVLGLDTTDAPIQRATAYLESALPGQIQTPDRVEKTHRWDIYMPLMLAAWLHHLSPANEPALATAHRWARIIGHAFSGDGYDQSLYLEAYREVFDDTPHPKAGRLNDFVHFYPLRLLCGVLPHDTVQKMLSYVIGHPPGIYYIYEGPVAAPPEDFHSRQAGRYLAALELLSEYPQAGPVLSFAADWLTGQMVDGKWDMGTLVKDGVYFPLSDSWRSSGTRMIDCTVRILALLTRLSPE
jgi:hypothetical protein